MEYVACLLLPFHSPKTTKADEKRAFSSLLTYSATSDYDVNIMKRPTKQRDRPASRGLRLLSGGLHPSIHTNTFSDILVHRVVRMYDAYEAYIHFKNVKYFAAFMFTANFSPLHISVNNKANAIHSFARWSVTKKMKLNNLTIFVRNINWIVNTEKRVYGKYVQNAMYKTRRRRR